MKRSYSTLALLGFALATLNTKADESLATFEPCTSETKFRTEMAATKASYWPNGSVLNVHFLGGSSEAMDMVEKVAQEWTAYANITFKFIRRAPVNGEISHIRIGFNSTKGNESEIGNDALDVKITEHTMNLAVLSTGSASPLSTKRKTILHEFGHALGLQHEHQNPSARFDWNVPVILKWCKDTQKWDQETCRWNIIDSLSVNSTNFTVFDENSVMLYTYPAEFNRSGRATNYNLVLSEVDKKGIAQIYPKDETKEPTSQTNKIETLKIVKSPLTGAYETNNAENIDWSSAANNKSTSKFFLPAGAAQVQLTVKFPSNTRLTKTGRSFKQQNILKVNGSAIATLSGNKAQNLLVANITKWVQKGLNQLEFGATSGIIPVELSELKIEYKKMENIPKEKLVVLHNAVENSDAGTVFQKDRLTAVIAEIEKQYLNGASVKFVNFVRGNWLVSMQPSSEVQKAVTLTTSKDLGQSIKDLWDEGFAVDSITNGVGGYLLIASVNTQVLSQSWVATNSIDYVQKQITEKRKLGFNVENLNFYNNEWTLLLSKLSTPYEQSITTGEGYEQMEKTLQKLLDEKQKIEQLVLTGAVWVVLSSSERTDISSQKMSTYENSNMSKDFLNSTKLQAPDKEHLFLGAAVYWVY